jgi:hypothetical protein
MATMNDYYVSWGGALGGALDNSGMLTSTSTTSSGFQGLQGWYEPQQQQMYQSVNLSNLCIQPIADVAKKTRDKAKSILESLRDEISNWCSSALEVA